MTDVLDRELNIFEQHREELLGSAPGKFVLIAGDRIVGTFDSKNDAIAQGYRELGNVPFLVKEITAVDTPINLLNRYAV